jgi:hypothetical protein
MIKCLRVFLFALGLCFISSAYSVDGPFFKMGETHAIESGNNVWNNLQKDCKNVREFTKIIGDSYLRVNSQAKGYGGSAGEYIEGYSSGLEKTIHSTIIDQCPRYQEFANSATKKGTPQTQEENKGFFSGLWSKKTPKQEQKKSSFFHLGQNLGVVETTSTWKNLSEDCRNLGKLEAIMTRSFNRAKQKFANVTGTKDFLEGYQQGMDSVINRIKNECTKPSGPQQATPPTTDECLQAAAPCANPPEFFLQGQRTGRSQGDSIMADLKGDCSKLPKIIDGLAQTLAKDLEGKYKVGNSSHAVTNFVDGYVKGLKEGLMNGNSCAKELNDSLNSFKPLYSD